MTQPPASGRIGPDFDVRDFGAAGDGRTRNTGAIQRAIDACAANGGGRVVVPAGVFVTGTLTLRSRVSLHLGMGAVLLGSPDLADYNRDDAFPQNQVFNERVTGAHLIVAVEATDVAIEGPGRIDGNSSAFFGPLHRPGGKFTIPGKRPGQMVHFVECERVRITDAALDNAPYWTCLLHGCSDVTIRGVQIDNPFGTPNGDGLDVDACRNVVISDCLIRSGDDSIAVRGNPARLKNPERICENIVVTNCVLSTPCNAIRVGVGDGAIRHCVFSNIAVTASRNGICLIGNYSDLSRKGADIEDVRFSNLTLDTVLPFYLFTGRRGACRIRDIVFSGIRAAGSKSSVVRGTATCRPAGIRFRDVEVAVGGGRETIGAAADLPGLCWEWDKGRPAAFYCACVDDLCFDRVKVRWEACDGPWRHALLAEDVRELTIRESAFPAPPTAAGAEGIRRSDTPG